MLVSQDSTAVFRISDKAMNSGLIYAKTPIGDEAVRQSTRVVQRNLRMVLVQVDGKLTVDELAAKIGNARLVESAIAELERGGYIVPLSQAAAAWEMGHPRRRPEQVSAISQFSTFGAKDARSAPSQQSQSSRFSSFGKPLIPAAVVSEPVRDIPTSFDYRDPIQTPGRSWGRIVLLGVGLVVTALVLLALFFPYDRYRSQFESVLTDALQVPVSIGNVTLKVLPAPRLVIHDLGFNDQLGGRIRQVDIHQPWNLALRGVSGVQDVSLHDAMVPVRRLLLLPALGLADASVFTALQAIQVSDLRVLTGSSVFFGPFQGRLNLAPGAGYGISLETADRSVLIEARPSGSALDFSLEGRGFALPALGATVPSVLAKGRLSESSLELGEIDASYLGGRVRGEWSLSWAGVLRMSAQGEARRLDLRQIGSALLPQLSGEGEVDTSISLTGQGDDWLSVWRGASARMAGTVSRGVVNGVDIGEATRRGVGAQVRAGSTRFDALRFTMAINADGASLDDLALDAGLLSASGQLRVTGDGGVRGTLVSQARTSVTTVRVPMTVSGALPALTLTTGR